MTDSLPIEAIRSPFLSGLCPGTPTIVVAPTGSGKSTRLPVWMWESLGGTVLVVEPRRVACRSLASYVASQLGSEVGERVGYRIRFEDRSGPETRILFVTPGVAVRMLRSGGDFPFSGVLLDEFHERGWETDLVLTVLRHREALGQLDVPLVLTSATLDAQALAERIGGRLLSSGGRRFPVSTRYTDDVPVPTPVRLESRVAGAVSTALSSSEGGDVLVFLPGMSEIDSCRRALSGCARSHGVELVRIHGALPTGAVARALSAADGVRRVFLATNVAETSLTIPNVTTVVDSGLVRMRMHRAGKSGLVLCPISQASMDQRSGRAGRVAPGHCVRLWSERFQPDAVTSPEIERVELDDLVLNALACGLPLDRFSGCGWPTEPPGFAVERASVRLAELGAVGEDGFLTRFGRRLLDIPLSVHEARLLIDVPSGLRATVADLVALLQARSRVLLPLHRLPGGGNEEIEVSREALLSGVSDEVTAELTALRSGNVDEHGLHGSALREARRLAAMLRRLLGCSKGTPRGDASPFPGRAELVSFLLSRWPESGFVLRERARGKRRGAGKRRGEPWANGEVELRIDPYGRWGRDDPKGAWPVAGLVLDHEWVGSGGKGIVGVGWMLLPCMDRDLLDAGLGEEILSDVRVEKRRDGQVAVLGRVSHEYAGVSLGTSEESLHGGTLRRVAAELILEGRLLRGVGGAVQDDLHLYRILSEWPGQGLTPVRPSQADVPLSAVEYTENCLERLGVEVAGDLALVDPGDLRLDLGSLFGLFPGRVDELRRAFPLEWEMNGVRYACQVNARGQMVTLEPVSGKAKRAGDPEAWMLPNFGGLPVRYRKASRIVQVR